MVAIWKAHRLCSEKGRQLCTLGLLHFDIQTFYGEVLGVALQGNSTADTVDEILPAAMHSAVGGYHLGLEHPSLRLASRRQLCHVHQ